MCNADQVMSGIVKYADSEIINKLPTIGKWFVGAGIGMAQDRINEIMLGLQHNQALKMLGVVDENGNFDIEMLATYLKKSADSYGKAYVEIPLLGKLTFSGSDIEVLKDYIERA